MPAAAICEDQSFLEMTDERWRKTLSVNLDGAFYISRRAVPVMPEGTAVLRMAKERTREDLWTPLGLALDHLTPTECRNSFRHAGYP